MDLVTLLLIAIGLAMDCFAVSLAVGTSQNIARSHTAGILALVFGSFQSGMCLAGWAVGAWLIVFISGLDHWVAFFLLTAIGAKMILEGLKAKEERKEIEVLQTVTLLLLAVATSIDSLGIGLSFALLSTDILMPAMVIGLASALFSFMGVMLGNRLAERFEEWIEVVGGVILIGIGLRILIEHLWV